MMYSKRKTLHYITKEMYFLCNSFVTTRPYPLIFMDNRLIHRIVQKKKKVCRNTRCAFFFFVDYKNRLIFLSCDILRISLIYAFSTSK